MSGSVLYYGDNLDILRRYVKDDSVDLIYPDPPFKSEQDYNILFAEKNGSQSKSQIKAFGDTWIWDEAAVNAYAEVVEKGPDKVSQTLQGFRTFIGPSDMLAYLSMMAPRLIELHRVLKPTGSIYLHCAPTASHYLKVLMDAVFGPANFRNEIIWKRTSAHSDPGRCGRVHDAILFYTKSEIFTWNQQYQPYDQSYIESHYRYIDESGRKYRTDNLTAGGLTGGGYEYEWKGVRKVWRCPKETMAKLDKEGRIKYTKTQKPEALLERVIKASSNEGDTILDPFCGCGTTVTVAQRLNRRWVGIDVTYLAIALIKHRLESAYEGKAEYEVVGEPVSLPDAQALAKQDPYQFQWWALGLVGARPVEQKKGADRGIDGRLYFHDEPDESKTKQIIFSVKAGNLKPEFVRELRGVVEREKAAMGVLISLEEPTKAMKKEAADAELYHSPGWNKKYPRIQLVTVGELLSGSGKSGIKSPPSKHANVTFKKAPKAKRKKDQTKHLPLY
jgi:DNA modification methylase